MTNPNKTRTIVIIEAEDYIEEAETKLSNKQNYRKKLGPCYRQQGKVKSRFPKENLLSKCIFERRKTENPKAV